MKQLLFLVLSMAIVLNAMACAKTPSTTQPQPTSSSATVPTEQPPPSKPMENSEPASPSEPVEDSKPTTPSVPVENSKPTTPSEPVENPKPTTPSAPVENSKPTTPSEPVENPKPTAPSEPVENPKPTTPSEPVDNSKPTTPSEPVETVPCSHRFEVTKRQDSTCTQAGYIQYTCRLCGQQKSTQLDSAGHRYLEASCTQPKQCQTCGEISGHALGHSYTDATCISAQICSRCGETTGDPLGHQYGENFLCVRCGAEAPDKPTDHPGSSFTLTIRGKGIAIAGITVSVYVDNSNTCAGSVQTDSKGKAVIPLTPGSSYTVILSDVPQGFAYQDSYTFSGLTANINLTPAPILDPNDHSQANYREGSTMADFSLTDVDGNHYTLSELLKEKNVVILNFWFIACDPCVSEFPYFEEFYQSFQDVQLLALNHFDHEAAIDQFRDRSGFTFPMIYEDLGMLQGFNLTAYPSTVVIGQNRKILSIHVGALNRGEVKALFESYTG